MTKTTGLTAPLSAAAGPRTEPAQVITRRLAAAGLAVHATQQQDQHELIILNIAARCCLTLTGDSHSQWHYEPGTGPDTDPATLTTIITHILKAPHAADGTTPGAGAYRAFPLKGIVGRCLQDRGLAVTLHVDEDLETGREQFRYCAPARPYWNFRRYPVGKTLVKPSKGSVAKHRQRLANEMRRLRGSNAGAVIGTLNPVIRGWRPTTAARYPARHSPRSGTTPGSSPGSGQGGATQRKEPAGPLTGTTGSSARPGKTSGSSATGIPALTC